MAGALPPASCSQLPWGIEIALLKCCQRHELEEFSPPGSLPWKLLYIYSFSCFHQFTPLSELVAMAKNLCWNCCGAIQATRPMSGEPSMQILRSGRKRSAWSSKTNGQSTRKAASWSAVQATSSKTMPRWMPTAGAENSWTRMWRPYRSTSNTTSTYPLGPIDSIPILMRVDVCHHVLRPCCIDKARGHLGMIKLVQRFATKRRCQWLSEPSHFLGLRRCNCNQHSVRSSFRSPECSTPLVLHLAIH